MAHIAQTTLGVGGAALVVALGVGLAAHTPTGPITTTTSTAISTAGAAPAPARLAPPSTAALTLTTTPLTALPTPAPTPTQAPMASTATPMATASGAWITLSSYSLTPGILALAIDGGGFAAGEIVDLQTRGAGAQATATLRADMSGRVDGVARLRVAADRMGPLRLTALGQRSRQTATAILSVLSYVPVLALQPYAARPGQAVSVQGWGFAPAEAVRLTLGSTTLVTLRADASGAVGPTLAYTVPYATADTHLTLMATGTASRRAAWQRLIVVPTRPWATASAYVVRPGASVSFDAHGFAAGERVTVYGGGVALYRDATPTDKDGNVSGLGPVLVAKGDEHPTYMLVGTRSGARVTVTLTAPRP